MQLRQVFTVIGIWNNMVSVCIDQTGVLAHLSITVDESNYGSSLSTQLTVGMGALSLYVQYELTDTPKSIRAVGLESHLPLNTPP